MQRLSKLQLVSSTPRMARVRVQISNKVNVVLHLEKELVEKSKEIGFNLSKIFKNQLKTIS